MPSRSLAPQIGYSRATSLGSQKDTFWLKMAALSLGTTASASVGPQCPSISSPLEFASMPQPSSTATLSGSRTTGARLMRSAFVRASSTAEAGAAVVAARGLPGAFLLAGLRVGSAMVFPRRWGCSAAAAAEEEHGGASSKTASSSPATTWVPSPPPPSKLGKGSPGHRRSHAPLLLA